MRGFGAIERTVTGLGYELVDVEHGPRGLLRVFIDRVLHDPAGEFVTVDDCERVTRQLQHVLEVEGTAYERLEVSSPGLDRPLKKPADYERFTGQEVDLTLKAPFQGRKRYRGVLQQPEPASEPAEAGEGPEHTTQPGWRLVFSDGKSEQALDFSLDEVREARLVPVVNFKGRASATPGSQPPSGGGNEVVDGDRKQ
jgi:ribosome maturation factor RimP